MSVKVWRSGAAKRTAGILSTIFVLSAIVWAQPGQLDPTFGGGDGIVVSDIGVEDRGYAIAYQPDGKIVAAGRSRLSGNSYPDLVVVRYNQDGSFDTSFGSGGVSRIVVTSISLWPEFNRIVIQPDGKIVGVCSFRTTSGALTKSGVVRLNTNGSLDVSFGTNGIRVIEAAVDAAIVLQPDGKIVTGGGGGTSSTSDFQIARLNADGSSDTTFDGDGILRIDFNGAGDGVYGLALQPDGKIVAAGRTYGQGSQDNYAVARVMPYGTIDASFGSGGKVFTDFIGGNDRGFGVAIQADGRIVVVGSTTGADNVPDFGIVRYNANGSLDLSFGAAGKAVTSIGVHDIAFNVKIQTNGKIVVVGIDQSVGTAAVVTRYNTDGSLDNTFSGDGKVVFNFYANDDARDLAIQSDGKILVAGTANGGDIIGKIAVARIIGDPVVSVSRLFDFDGDGRADASVFRPSDRTWYQLRSQTGFAAMQFGLASDLLAPADYDGDGKTDIAVYRDGAWYIERSQAGFTAMQFGTAGDLPRPADVTGDGRAEIAVFRPSSGVWYIYELGTGQTTIRQFGVSEDRPVTADFTGDGCAEIAVFRPSSGDWYHLDIATGQYRALHFGQTGDRPAAADYDGDGKADIAIYRDGTWHILGSTRGYYTDQFGIASDIPVPADYDGDGKADVAVFRQGTWYLLRSTAGLAVYNFGAAGDMAIPAAFIQ